MTNSDIHSDIRVSKIEDLPEIVEIYNLAIRKGICTGHLEEFQVAERQTWYWETGKFFPIHVLEKQKQVIGYGTLSPWRPGRQAMNKIVEVSIFLHEDWQGQGLGSQFLDYLLSECKQLEKQVVLAILLEVNTPSVALLKKFGFAQWGYFPDAVDLRKQKCAQVIYGLKLCR